MPTPSTDGHRPTARRRRAAVEAPAAPVAEPLPIHEDHVHAPSRSPPRSRASAGRGRGRRQRRGRHDRRGAALEPIIRLEGLSFYYGAFRAVKDVSIAFEPKQHHRPHRPVGLRQVDAAADDQPHERPDPRDARRGQRAVPRHRPVREGRRRGRGPSPDRHGVPEAEPVPEVDLRQHRVRAADQRHEGQHGRDRRGRASAGRRCGTTSRTSSSSPASRCRAASSSACASPARSPPART